MLGPFAPYSTLMPLKSVFRVLPKSGYTLSRTVSPRSNQIVSYDHLSYKDIQILSDRRPQSSCLTRHSGAAAVY